MEGDVPWWQATVALAHEKVNERMKEYFGGNYGEIMSGGYDGVKKGQADERCYYLLRCFIALKLEGGCFVSPLDEARDMVKMGLTFVNLGRAVPGNPIALTLNEYLFNQSLCVAMLPYTVNAAVDKDLVFAYYKDQLAQITEPDGPEKGVKAEKIVTWMLIRQSQTAGGRSAALLDMESRKVAWLENVPLNLEQAVPASVGDDFATVLQHLWDHPSSFYFPPNLWGPDLMFISTYHVNEDRSTDDANVARVLVLMQIKHRSKLDAFDLRHALNSMNPGYLCLTNKGSSQLCAPGVQAAFKTVVHGDRKLYFVRCLFTFNPVYGKVVNWLLLYNQKNREDSPILLMQGGGRLRSALKTTAAEQKLRKAAAEDALCQLFGIDLSCTLLNLIRGDSPSVNVALAEELQLQNPLLMASNLPTPKIASAVISQQPGHSAADSRSSVLVGSGLRQAIDSPPPVGAGDVAGPAGSAGVKRGTAALVPLAEPLKASAAKRPKQQSAADAALNTKKLTEYFTPRPRHDDSSPV